MRLAGKKARCAARLSLLPLPKFPARDGARLEIWTAAPDTARLFRPLDAAGRVCLGFEGIRNQTPLWTNSDISSGASTPSSFGAQTISLDLSSYSAVMIVFTSSVSGSWFSGAENGEMTALTLPINGQTYTLLYPYNTVTRRNVRVSTTGVRFYGGYERHQYYSTGITTTFQLAEPLDSSWQANNNCCVPCYIYGFM